MCGVRHHRCLILDMINLKVFHILEEISSTQLDIWVCSSRHNITDLFIFTKSTESKSYLGINFHQNIFSYVLQPFRFLCERIIHS